MAEKGIFFPAKGINIEGRLYSPDSSGGGAVVVCHPHPQFGGSMDNNVVRAVSEALCEAGFQALTFNFRGVGRSEGSYEDGIGEQDDVKGALDCLEKAGAGNVFVVGYSFGAWVGLWAASDDERVKGVVGISPPLTMFDFGFFACCALPKLLVAGTADQVCPPKALKEFFETLQDPKSLESIPGADHFFFGNEEPLSQKVAAFLGTLR